MIYLIPVQEVTWAFAFVAVAWTSLLTTVFVFLALWLHKELTAKNITASCICILLSFVASYGYYLFFIALTDMGFFTFESYALVIFLFQTIFWLLWFHKKKRAFILSLVAASSLSLLLSVYSLKKFPRIYKNYLATPKKQQREDKDNRKSLRGSEYFPGLESELKNPDPIR